jgi:hypothetical protein
MTSFFDDEDLKTLHQDAMQCLVDWGYDPEEVMTKATENLVYWEKWNADFVTEHGRLATAEELYHAAGGEVGTYEKFLEEME